MALKKIAIIGGGIVGSVCAFYLTKAGQDVTLFDHGVGQASKAAVGIICPWVSQRRNKDWYQLVDEGSIFYHKLIKDLEDDSFYQASGALLSHPSRLDKMYELALSRRINNSIMGDIKIMQGQELKDLLPEGLICERALYIQGASRVDGGLCVEVLNSKSIELGMKIVKEKVSFKKEDALYEINGVFYDTLVLSAGAWLESLLYEHRVDVRPQKGQLIEFVGAIEKNNYPLYIPKGEIDLLYKNDGSVVVGASHDDEAGFDLLVEASVSKHLIQEAKLHLPKLEGLEVDAVRVGSRAYTSDYLPFYGSVQDYDNCYVASGLGSSGLTSGPIIGYRVSQYVMGLEEAPTTTNYVSKRDNSQ